MKLLFIDDNTELANSLAEFLSGTWEVTTVDNGKAGIELGSGGGYDIILLDINLPDISGHTVCRKLRQSGASTPIIVLSGVSEASSKISLLQSGADDYVTKPFNGQELKARIQALLRRGRLDPGGSYLLRVEGLVLDPHKRCVERDGCKIILRRKEFDILEYLLRNHGRVVTRTMIMDNVWEVGSDPWNNTIDVHIKSLRDKIDRPFKEQLISTTYGVGYTINGQKK